MQVGVGSSRVEARSLLALLGPVQHAGVDVRKVIPLLWLHTVYGGGGCASKQHFFMCGCCAGLSSLQMYMCNPGVHVQSWQGAVPGEDLWEAQTDARLRAMSEDSVDGGVEASVFGLRATLAAEREARHTIKASVEAGVWSVVRCATRCTHPLMVWYGLRRWKSHLCVSLQRHILHAALRVLQA